MSFGALTLGSQGPQQASSPLFADDVSLVGDAAYPTGGTTGLAALLQAQTKDGRAPFAVIPGDCGGYFVTYDPSTDKLKVFWCAAAGSPMAEVTNATNLSGVTFKFTVLSQ